MKTNPNADLPPAFLETFRKLARRTRTPRIFEPETARDYFEALQDFSLAELAAAAEACARTMVFFPAVAEWRNRALHLRIDGPQPVLLHCDVCADRGLIVMRYRSGEALDIAWCGCPASEPWRRGGPALVRGHFGLTDENRIGELDQFDEEPEVVQ